MMPPDRYSKGAMIATGIAVIVALCVFSLLLFNAFARLPPSEDEPWSVMSYDERLATER